MRDDLIQDLFIAPEERDPLALARKDARTALPKRFYKEVDVAPDGTGFAITLDGRKLKTPAKADMVLPTQAAAEAIAAEWRAQGEDIDPRTMPLTRLVNSTLDGVARDTASVIDDIVRYAGSDLICYRAAEPEGLVAAQSETWDPVLTFARDQLGARFICVEGITFAEQPTRAVAAVREAVVQSTGERPLAVAALHVMTTLMGSVLLALSVAHGQLSPEAAWDAAHVDEDFQMRVWGADAEALERRVHRFKEMQAAAQLIRLIDE
ncbi:MAG: ATPase [Methylobacteriaceae bacterium]|nr:ATPase [Methylobacteriaceae bacterium]